MDAILGFIFVGLIVAPAIWYARRFFRNIKEDAQRHQDHLQEARRRRHWLQNWRRK